MSLRFVVDMNLSAEWVAVLSAHGWSARHWSTIGRADAPDAEIMAWARHERRVVFYTRPGLRHDAGTDPRRRAQRHPDSHAEHGAEDIGPAVVAAVQQHTESLAAGALVVVDLDHSRVRVLPL